MRNTRPVTNTPTRSFRCDDAIWEAAVARAAADGLTMTAVLTRYLKYYGRQRSRVAGRRTKM
jgi:hypothetical protein